MPGSLVSTRASFSAASIGAVGDGDLACVNGAADADSAAVVNRHPRRAGRGVDQRVEQWPVGDRVGAVEHRLGLAVRRGDRTGVEVIAADHDRGGQFARRHHLVELQPREMALAVAEPADARGQPLECDPLAGHLDPPGEVLVIGEEFEDRAVGGGDVLRVTRQRRPAERPEALLELRPDVGGHEAGEVESPVVSGLSGLVADGVAVVEHLGAAVLEADHRRDVLGHRLLGLLGEVDGILVGHLLHVVELDADRAGTTAGRAPRSGR